MGKVVLMLQEMLSKSKNLQTEAATQHAVVSQACTDNTAQADTEISTLSSSVQSLEAAVLQLEADINQGQVDVRDHRLDIERYDQDWASAKAEYAKVVADYEKDLATYDQAINAAERAQLVVRTQVPAASLVEVHAALDHALRIAEPVTSSRSASFLSRDRRYAPGGMTRDEHIFDEFEGVSSAKGSYSQEMTSIEATIEDVLNQFRTYKSQLLTSKQRAKANLDSTLSSLERQMKRSKSSMNYASQEVADKKTTLVTTQKDLVDQRALLAKTTEYRSKLVTACSEKEKAYQEMSTLRKNEIAALDKAILLLEEHAPKTGALLRTGILKGLREVADPAAGEEKVLGFLRMQARKLDSGSLDQLAGQLEAFVEAQGSSRVAQEPTNEDPVTQDAMMRVKTMIQDLITRLQTEAAAEATHHAWCTSELAKNEAARSSAQDGITKHTAKVAQLQAAIDKLEIEIAQANATLSKGATDRTELEAQRSDMKAENEAAIADADASAEALDAAMALIKEYYASASKSLALIRNKPKIVAVRSGAAGKNSSTDASAAKKLSLATADHQHRQLPEEVTQEPVDGPLVDESTGVLAMLEVVRDGYKEISSKTRQEEEQAAREHVQALQDIDVMLAAAQQDQTYKMQMKDDYASALAEGNADLTASTQALADAQNLHERLKSPCINAETAEERMAKRQEEIDALNEAYNMLVSYSSEQGYSMLQAAAPAAPAPQGAAAKVPSKTSVNPASAPSSPASAIVALKPKNSTSTPGAVALSMAKVHQSGATDPSVAEDVAQLLVGIKAEVESELAEDTRIYEENKKWCDDTIAKSQAAIQAADERDQELMTLLETSTQSKAQLEVQIERLKAELKKERHSLEQSKAIRENDAEKFRENEKELLESIHALTHALVVLSSKYNQTESRDYAAEREQLEQEKIALAGATGTASLVRVAGEVKKALGDLPAEEAAMLAGLENGAVLQEFLAQPSEVLAGRRSKLSAISLGAAIGDGPSASGQQIYGILQQLLATFKEDLEASRSREASEGESFTSLRDTKEVQIQALVESIASKENQLAIGSVSNAQAKEDLAYVRESRKAEMEYLMNVQAQCREIEFEYQARKATRENEIASLSEAIAILNEGGETVTEPMDQAQPVHLHAVAPAAAKPRAALSNASAMHKAPAKVAAPTPKPMPKDIVDAFIKSHSTKRPSPSRSGFVARRPSNRSLVHLVPPAPIVASAVSAAPRPLSALGLRARVFGKQAPPPNVQSAFDSIVVALDKIRTTLVEEKAQEAKMQELCVQEKHEAEVQLEREKHNKAAQDSAIQRLTAVVGGSGTNIEDLEAQIKELSASIDTAKADRADQHEAFKKSIQAQEVLQAKLRQAVDKLKAFYGSKANSASLLQQSPNDAVVSKKTAKPDGYKRPLQKHGASKGVIAILELLVEDSEQLVESIVDAEQKAQDAYAVNVADTRRAIQDYEHQIIVQQATGTNAGVELESAKEKLQAVEAEIADIENYMQIVATKCDALVANFAESQTARQAQIDNIAHAKEIFRGALGES